MHLVTSVFFDIGVYLVVIGLVLDLARSLGAGIDRHERGPDARRMPIDRTAVRPRASPRPRRALGGGGSDEPEPDPRDRRRRAVRRGVYLMLERSLTRVLVGVLLVGNGVNLLFLVAAGRAGGRADRRRRRRRATR